MDVYEVDPIRDPRWSEFVQKHPHGSVFHTPSWLEALRRTYGYEPLVLTTSAPGEDLTNGVGYCRIQSWLTGRRLVSLPFSDHCEPLYYNIEEFHAILQYLENRCGREKWKYVELRPRHEHRMTETDFEKSDCFYLHVLDLQPSIESIFRSFSKDSIQRKIRRAEREGLICEEGRSEFLLGQFYRLILLTRRRHELPPPPLDWFRNLVDCMGDMLTLRVAFKNSKPIAALLTLSYKNTLVYKYGCSNAEFHNLGGMPFLFWRTIVDAKKRGALELDLGRSDLDNHGLVQFKERLGATRSALTYVRFPAKRARSTSACWKMQVAKRIFAFLPDRCLITAGRLLYPHIG